MVRRDNTHWLLLSGLVALLVTGASLTKADPDLWGHLRFGLDTLQSHRLTPVDPYSFTQDRPWLNHEWLSELQMGAAYAMAGAAGLSLLKGALACCALAVLWTALRGVMLEVRMVLLGVVAIGTVGITYTLRPQLWSLVCLGIVCLALVENHPRARRWLPLLFVLWANLHGGWIVGLGVLTLWGTIEACLKPERRREWAIILIGCAAATLCTPYGWRLWQFLLQTVQLARPRIEEWQPLWTLPVQKWIPWLVTAGAAVWGLRLLQTHRWHSAAVLTMLAFASARVARVAPLFIASAAILLAPALLRRWPARARATPARSSRSDRIAAVALFFVAAAASTWIAARSLPCVAIEGAGMPEAAPVRTLAGAPPGRIVTFFDWGEYAIWHLGPRIRVSMDGRRETAYSDRRLAEHDAILIGSVDGLRTLSEWQTEYVWLPASSVTTKEWLAAHGYRIELETARSFLAVRRDLPSLVVPAPAPARQAACFPG